MNTIILIVLGYTLICYLVSNSNKYKELANYMFGDGKDMPTEKRWTKETK